MDLESRFCMERLFSLLPKISSSEIVKKLNEAGYHMSESTFNRLKRNQKDLKINELIMFADVFGFRPEQVFCQKGKETAEIPNVRGFVANPDMPEFNGYKGEYYCWFYSTAQEENGKLIEGKMFLEDVMTEAGRKYCRASVLLSLDAGFEKKFEGNAVISEMGVIWVTLTEEGKGDFAVVAFRHRMFDSDCLCRMGMFLTISAGDRKLPAVGKIFISRLKYSEEEMGNMLVFLKLEPAILRIPHETWDKWKEENPGIYGKILECEEHTHLIELSNMIKRKEFAPSEIAELISLAKNDSIIRLDQIDDDISYLLLEKCRKEAITKWKVERGMKDAL